MRRRLMLAAFLPLIAFTPVCIVAAQENVLPPTPTEATAGIDPVIEGMAGPFMFAQGSGGPECRVELSTEAVIHAFAIIIPDTCIADFPLLAEIAGWTMLEDGTLRLTDALGKGIQDFTETESGLFLSGEPPGYSMVNVDESDFAETQPVGSFPEKHAGAYVLSQAEAPDLARCEVNLLLEAGGEDWYLVSVDPSCPTELLRFEIIGWRPAPEGIMLIGKPGEIGVLAGTELGPLEGKIEPGLTLRLVRI